MNSTSFLRRALIVALMALAGSSGALAQEAGNYPSQPIKLIVPVAPGGSTDAIARLIGQKLTEVWHQPVVVENRPGASGTIGATAVTKAPPDGYTVLLAITTLVQAPALMAKPPYNAVKDLQAVSQLGVSPSPMLVPAALPVTTLRDFIIYSKSHPHASFGSWGNGSTAHVLGLLLNRQAGLDMVHVPYKGVPPIATDLIGEQLTAGFTDMATAITHSKKLKALAVAAPERVKAMPDVPTFKELGFRNMDRLGWYGFFMPAGTPMPIVNKFSAEVTRIMRLPDVAARISDMAIVPVGSKPAEFAAVVRGDAQFYARTYKELDIRAD
jgi:tripartite-type tricarboxylate transporter receptor subunit TctC